MGSVAPAYARSYPCGVRHAGVAAIAAVLGSCTAEPAETAEGSAEPLFDGRTLSGLRPFAQDGVDAKSLFRVDGDELVVSGSALGYLVTERALGDFRITFEWKWVTPGNSGFFVALSGPDAIWPRTIEMQLLVDRAGDLLALGGFPMHEIAAPPDGKPVAAIAHREKRESPVGQWSKGEIAMRSGRITVRVNEVLVNEAQVSAEERGRVAFEAEGGEIRFRNVLAHAD